MGGALRKGAMYDLGERWETVRVDGDGVVFRHPYPCPPTYVQSAEEDCKRVSVCLSYFVSMSVYICLSVCVCVCVYL